MNSLNNISDKSTCFGCLSNGAITRYHRIVVHCGVLLIRR
ncbi:Uncharacterised protein [Vibrio cholerae]|nr:Uncharacterised protein [Vibrio cholerae]